MYKNKWHHGIRKVQFEVDPNNKHDYFAVKATFNSDLVGYAPKEIAKVLHLFLIRGGNVVGVKITKFTSTKDLGIEAPCQYICAHPDKKDAISALKHGL